MSHANKADKLLIKPTAGARPAPPCTPGRFIAKAHPTRPDARRVTSDTEAPASQRPLTDRPAESHRRLTEPSLTSRIQPLHDRVVAFVVMRCLAATCMLICVVACMTACGGTAATHRSHRPTAVTPGEIRAFFNDWYADGRIDGSYPCAVVEEAIRRLPEDPPIGSTALQDFRAYEKQVC
jgi:hypothetical protein